MVAPKIFFSFQNFAHQALWKEGEPVWSPLVGLSDYLSEQVLGRIEIKIPEGVFLERPDLISIGKGTVIEPGVFIKGPCIIGKNCTIRHGAYIRGNVICGDSCAIGHCTELKHAILLDGAVASHFVYVGDSILGRSVNLGAGVKCANVRLDKKEIGVDFDGSRFKTGLKKLGAILGDGVQIGCNCVLNPGVLMGRECLASPLLVLSGYTPAKTQIRATENKFVGK